MYYLQAVHEIFELEASEQDWKEFEYPRETKIVFIGRGVTDDIFFLHECTVEVSTATNVQSRKEG